jgi:hypothetical protein
MKYNRESSRALYLIIAGLAGAYVSIIIVLILIIKLDNIALGIMMHSGVILLGDVGWSHFSILCASTVCCWVIVAR